jgi:hypothetical protein
MPRTTDWRSQSTADALNRLDRSGLAWEFLRRNPEYRTDYGRAISDIAPVGDSQTGDTGEVARSWGLCFPRQPGSAGEPGPCTLAA